MVEIGPHVPPHRQYTSAAALAAHGVSCRAELDTLDYVTAIARRTQLRFQYAGMPAAESYSICCLSLLLVGLDATIVNVALPAIHRSFHASLAGLQWVIDAYTLVIASFLMLAGFHGRPRPGAGASSRLACSPSPRRFSAVRRRTEPRHSGSQHA